MPDPVATLELAMELMRCPSVTPRDAGCQQLIGERLAQIGFRLEPLPFGEVENLWARRGNTAPLLLFAGHTDVVPTGPVEAWSSPPFVPTLVDGILRGRGAADMKGSLAAMVTACEAFVARHPEHRGSIAFLLTSDEEGPSVDGTVRVVETLMAREEQIDFALVGEPSSDQRLGDVVKNGRRGSLNGWIKVIGKQGHIAYPQLADNPIQPLARALAELSSIEWDRGNAFFPPTSFQISNISGGTGVTNVIPGTAEAVINFRYSTEVTAEQLEQQVEAVLARHAHHFKIDWMHNGLPFLTGEGPFLDAVSAAVQTVTGQAPQLSTSGGTSDGRFIALTGAQVVELGPVNATIHKIDEQVAAADLAQLAQIYFELLVRVLGTD